MHICQGSETASVMYMFVKVFSLCDVYLSKYLDSLHDVYLSQYADSLCDVYLSKYADSLHSQRRAVG